MNWKDLLQAALSLVVAFGLRWLLIAISVELNEEVFVAIVSGIVTWLLGLFFVEAARAAGVRGIK